MTPTSTADRVEALLLQELPETFTGCGDHGCAIRSPKGGMGTNARCRCSETDLRRALRWHLDQKAAALAALAEGARIG